MIVHNFQLHNEITKLSSNSVITIEEINALKDNSEFHQKLFESVNIFSKYINKTIKIEITYVGFTFVNEATGSASVKMTFGLNSTASSITLPITGELGNIQMSIVKPLLKSDAQLILESIII